MQRSRKSKCKGLTLIELIIVIVVIGVLVIVATSIVATKTVSLGFVTEQLVADIRHTQQMAMSLNQRYRVRLNQNDYSILNASGNAVPNPSDSHGATVMSLKGAVLTSNPQINYLIFDNRGAPYSGDASNAVGTALTGDVTLVLALGAHTKTITINQYTGFARIQ